ncbi:hypothetical protein TNCV_4383931 [Trichonephila clavipes]|nr:hypothetical protein TNCV_4383931 [Trichonephila clavipes]
MPRRVAACIQAREATRGVIGVLILSYSLANEAILELAPKLQTSTQRQRKDFVSSTYLKVIRTQIRFDRSNSNRNLVTTHLLRLQYNMLIKYQMIKFIDFSKVSFLPESAARVAAIVGDHRCHTPRH